MAGARLGAGVILSEFVANNTSGLRDGDQEFSDWIELRNTESDPVNLAGWSLTDDPGVPGKWVFPSVVLPGQGYLVVFASGKDRRVAGGPLHTSFQLDAGGEYLGLFRPEVSEAESAFEPAFPPQSPNISYGVRDGQYWYFTTPTPGAANSGGVANFVADTRFSLDRGFVDGPFSLTITCATPGATIRYTTNGAPPTATTGLVYSGPVQISRTTVVRAAAFKDGLQPSNVDTQTYLMVDDIIRQSPDGRPMPGWPAAWGGNSVDYGMDPAVVDSARYRDTIRSDLKTIPSFSIVTELRHLFDSATGIYANPGQDGRAWERPCSVELIYPDGRKGFHINAGLRIRGGFSRSTGNPKHAFRLFFREEYGAAKLKYPLFGEGAADEFDAVDLRTFQNYSWSFQGDSRGIFMRDQFSRDSQLDMGSQAERGDYYHLYINGVYWGLYNTCERPEASYGETYFGGRKEDYDVIKVEAGPYTINATDGTLAAWTRLHNAARAGLADTAAYFRIQGRNPDGTLNAAYENLVDVDNLIDYMLVIFYGGNLDAPISNFLGNQSPNNWYGLRNRTGQFGGFRFFAHDAEHTLLNVSENRVGPFSAGATDVTKSSPQSVMQRMWENPEFRIRIADRIQRHFFNGGALTPEACRARLLRRRAEIDRAVVGESARWGDAQSGTPYTRDTWVSAVNSVLNDFFPTRTSVVLGQLRQRSLYPSVAAPSFNQHGGFVNDGFEVTLSAPAGQILVTTGSDSDPRRVGGEVALGAVPYTAPVVIRQTTTLKARALNGTNWSAAVEATFRVRQTFRELHITELMYHPVGDGSRDADDFEFLELKNVGSAILDLSGVRFTNGITFEFPAGTRLGPGRFAVLVADRDAFTNRYPAVSPAGVYQGRLANNGEQVTLVHADGTPLFDLTYDDAVPWPESADGGGFSLVPRDPNVNPDPRDPARWRASSRSGGSPGVDDVAPGIPGIVINEVLANASGAQDDAIELHNPTAGVVDVGGWYLTDDRLQPKKYRIPDATKLPAGGYAVFTGSQFGAITPGGTPFRFRAAGDEAYVYSADAQGNLTGHSDGVVFGAMLNQQSLGRWTNSVGDVRWVPQAGATFGAPNAGPRVGPVVFNEIQYHPAPGDVEFIEVRNLTGAPVPLHDPLRPTNTWRINGIGIQFPPGLVIPPGGLALVVNGDPALVRSALGVPASVPIVGPFGGSLSDGGERLELQMPGEPYAETNGIVVEMKLPWITVDEVRYDAAPPWPVAAGGGGSSLERVTPPGWADDPVAWRASTGIPTPGGVNDGNRPPVTKAGDDRGFVASTYPFEVTLSGSSADDGLPANPGRLAYDWEQISGPEGVVIVSSRAAATAIQLPGQGTYTFRFSADDGERRTSDEVTVQVARPAVEGTLVPFESVWKYFDLDSDLGTAWKEPAFDDRNWKSGRARLGYSDSPATTINGGPTDARIPTAYFRRTFSLADAAGLTAARVMLVRDDGAVVYVNGVEVFRSNMPEGVIRFSTLASSVTGNADETTPFERVLSPAVFRTGDNVLAVEVHQANATSSDLGFDLSLAGTVTQANAAPTVDAGSDLDVRIDEEVTLRGKFADDGLPSTPGVPAFSWVKASGPGEVTFANPKHPWTRVTFSAAGVYQLRLRVTDGEAAAADNVQVVVRPLVAPVPPILAWVVDGEGLKLRFGAEAGRAYVLEARGLLGAGGWQVIREFAPGAGRDVEAAVGLDEAAERYFRVRIP